MSRTPGTSLRGAVLGIGLATLLASGAHLLAQTAPIPFVDSGAASSALPTLKSEVVGVEMLTDAQGGDFAPYIKEVIQRISPSSRATKTVSGSVSAPGTLLTVTIDRNGKLIALHLDESSHDSELDRAAWSVLQQNSLPPFQRLHRF
jgi:hypothetical protein